MIQTGNFTMRILKALTWSDIYSVLLECRDECPNNKEILYSCCRLRVNEYLAEFSERALREMWMHTERLIGKQSY